MIGTIKNVKILKKGKILNIIIRIKLEIIINQVTGPIIQAIKDTKTEYIIIIPDTRITST